MSGDDRIRVRKARVTVKDLARDLSLSTSTISRAFYDDAVIAPSTRTAVLTRAAEIGYAPNPLARSLITKRTRIAGVVTSDINNPFYPEVLTRLTERLREIDLNVMLTAAGSSDSLDDAVKLLLSYQPDVVIVLAATLSSEAAEACGHAGTPVLFFNRRPAERRRIRRDLRQCRRRAACRRSFDQARSSAARLRGGPAGRLHHCRPVGRLSARMPRPRTQGTDLHRGWRLRL